MGFRIEDLHGATLPLTGSELVELQQGASSRSVRVMDLLPGFDGDTLAAELAAADGAEKVGAVLEGEEVTAQVALDKLSARLLGIGMAFSKPSDISAAQIPASVAHLFTECALVSGYGAAVFDRYPGPVAADGYFIVQSADGAKWKSKGKPNPVSFGAVPGTDITAAMQRWANYVSVNNEDSDWGIIGTVSQSITLTAPVSGTHSRKISGALQVKPGSAQVTNLFTFTKFEKITIEFIEYLDANYGTMAGRKVQNAFKFIECKYLHIEKGYGVGCRRFFIDVGYYSTEFTFGHINTLYNGACWATPSNTVAFATHDRQGTGVDQRSVLTGVTVPVDLEVGDGLISYGTYYHVREITGTTVKLFPAMDALDFANIAGAHWVYGGGGRHKGGDTNCGMVGYWGGLVNGHDFVCDELYPASFAKFTSQLSSVGLRVGTSRIDAYRGGSIGDAYIENTKIFCVELAQGGDNPYSIGQVGQFTPDKSFQFADYIDNATASTGTKNQERNQPHVKTAYNHRTVAFRGESQPIVSTLAGNTPVTTVSVQESAGGFGKVIKLKLDPVEYAAHGRYSLLIPVLGTSSGNPGSVTFKSEDGYSVMGAAEKTVTLNACIILAAYNNGNWTLVKTGDLSYVV